MSAVSRRISFDLDGTLVRSAFTSHVMPAVAVELGLADRADAVQSALIARHEQLLAEGRTVTAYDWQAHVDALPMDVDHPVGTVDVGELARQYNTSDQIRVLHSQTHDTLVRLRDAGHRLAVITNGFRAFQVPVLKAAGLWELFDDLVTTDDVGQAKPHATIFTASFGGDGPQVHVGDRIEHDILGASQAGARTILLHEHAPVCGRTDELDDQARHALQVFCGELARAERSPEVDPQNPPLPDLALRHLKDLPAGLVDLT